MKRKHFILRLVVWTCLFCNIERTAAQFFADPPCLNQTERIPLFPADRKSFCIEARSILLRREVHGTIPSTIGVFENLHQLFLELNWLSGTIPTEVGKLSELRRFYVYRNLLTGQIPKEIGLLTNLEDFRINHNAFSGRLPEEISALSKLEHLTAVKNPLLTGGIRFSELNVSHGGVSFRWEPLHVALFSQEELHPRNEFDRLEWRVTLACEDVGVQKVSVVKRSSNTSKPERIYAFQGLPASERCSLDVAALEGASRYSASFWSTHKEFTTLPLVSNSPVKRKSMFDMYWYVFGGTAIGLCMLLMLWNSLRKRGVLACFLALFRSALQQAFSQIGRSNGQWESPKRNLQESIGPVDEEETIGFIQRVHR